MKNTALAVMILVCLVSSVCLGQMTPHYDTYTTYALDANDNVSQTVVVEGYTQAQCTFTYVCGPNNQQCTGTYPWCSQPVTHTPSIYNVVNGIGGWSNGTPVNPFSYSVFSTTTTAPLPPAPATVPASTEAKIICSVVGTIFDSQAFTTKIGERITYYGPPPITGPDDSCSYNMLACSTGKATCKQALVGIIWVPSCPNYVRAANLVVSGTCLVSYARSASGPGPCN